MLNDEQNLGFGLDGLHYVMYVLLRATVIDFADDLLDHTRRPSARGSLWCMDCGRFVGRRALGYGQLYCSDRCKKRAAKRRYRGRNRELAPPAPLDGSPMTAGAFRVCLPCATLVSARGRTVA